MLASQPAQAGCRIAELDGVACGIGPGSFTSLRVGVAYAQGMAMGADCRIVGLSSLAMLAHSAGPGRWVAALDARMGELYVGAYTVSDTGVTEPVGAEWVGKAADAARMQHDRAILRVRKDLGLE